MCHYRWVASLVCTLRCHLETYLSFQKECKGGFPPPSPEAELWVFTLSFGPSSLSSCLGGWTDRPTEFNHSLVLLRFFEDFGWRWTWEVSWVISILEFSTSHWQAVKARDTTSFQSSSSKVSSFESFVRRRARHIAFDLWFLGGYYEEYRR